MPTDSLFVPLAVAGAPATANGTNVDIIFNGEKLQVPAGASVAASLLAAGVKRFRTSPVSGEGRAPYCMMGACFECLLGIDGVPNRQGCLIPIKPGMNIRTQDSLSELPFDDNSPALALTQAMKVIYGR